MKKVFLVIITLIVFTGISNSQSITKFKKGDRVVFMGNSITDGGHYHSYIWLYYMTHFPNKRIEIINSGIGGDIASQMYARLDSEVFSKKPTVMTLTFGMNDTGYQNFLRNNAREIAKEKIQTSISSYQLIEKRLKDHPEIQKIMIASSPYDETSRIRTVALPKKNEAMLEIANYQKESALKNKWEYLDFNGPMTEINLREQKKDSLFTLCGQDRIHPTNDGHMVMAYIFLKEQGFSNQYVASIEINADKNKVQKAGNCRITGLASSLESVRFDYLANSLPYPLDTIPRSGSGGSSTKRQSDALKIIPFTTEFNQELLKVVGLNKDGKYRLLIDRKLIGTWTGETFATGINLALLKNTPQYQQALAIMHLNEERFEIERRLREYYWIHFSILANKGLLFNDSESTYDSLKVYARRDAFVRATLGTYQKARLETVRNAWKKEMNLLVDYIYEINKPIQHRIEIELIR